MGIAIGRTFYRSLNCRVFDAPSSVQQPINLVGDAFCVFAKTLGSPLGSIALS